MLPVGLSTPGSSVETLSLESSVRAAKAQRVNTCVLNVLVDECAALVSFAYGSEGGLQEGELLASCLSVVPLVMLARALLQS